MRAATCSARQVGATRLYGGVAEATLVIGVLIGIAVRAANPAAQSQPAGPMNVQSLSSVSSRGTQPTITCPPNAVVVASGANIQTLVNAHAGRTTFCLRAGVHSITYSITPRTGDTFVGEYGAVLDAATWAIADPSHAAVFTCENQDIDDVTITNLMIRNMNGKAISAFYLSCDRWTVDHVELTSNKRSAILLGNDSVFSNSLCHHNVGALSSSDPNVNGGCYTTYRSTNLLFVNNEIAYNGPEQKMFESEGIVFRGNYVHHNIQNGFWSDGSREVLVEDNLFEDNGLVSIQLELSANSTVRRNFVRRSGWQAIALSTSHDSAVYENVSEDSGRGIGLAVDCHAIAEGGAPAKGWDLANNTIYNNTIKVGTGSVPFASGPPFANGLWITNCTDLQTAPYLNGSKNNRYANNIYYVPDVAGSYWHWGRSGLSPWRGWLTVGQDTTGTVVVR